MHAIYTLSNHQPVVVITEHYAEPLNPTHFVTSEAYRAYVELFYLRPLNERLIKRTVHVPH